MNLMIGNSIVTDNVYSVNFNKLKAMDQIVIFKEQYIKETESYVNNITTMILTRKIFNIIYTFDCSTTIPKVYLNNMYDDNDENSEFVDSAVDTIGYYNENYEENYILINNKFLKLEKVPYYNNKIEDNPCNVTKNFLMHIYKNIFEYGNNSMVKVHNYNHCFAHDEYLHNTLSFPLDTNNNSNDLSLLLDIECKPNLSNKINKVSTGIYLLHKNGYYINLFADFEEFLFSLENNIKHPFFKDEYTKFKELYNISNFNIIDFLQDKSKLLNIAKFCNYDNNLSYKFEQFYEPIYINEDLNIKIYPKSIFYSSNEIIMVLNNEIIEEHEVNDTKIKNQFKIGREILRFIRSDECRINPIDGFWYNENKDRDEKREKQYIVYKDESGMFVKNHRFYSSYYIFYYKLDGYWIQTNDDKICKEIRSRKEMLDILSN